MTQQQEHPGAKPLTFDHYEEGVVADPYKDWQRLRSECPVYFSERYDGFYFVPRYENVWNGLVDNKNYSVHDGSSIPQMPVKFIPLNIDPPDQRTYRRLVDQALAPHAMKAHEWWIRECAIRLLEPLQGVSEFDFVEGFAKPYPSQVIFRLLGMTEDLHDVEEWCSTLMWKAQVDPEGAGEAGTNLTAYLQSFLDSRRGQPAPDDLTSLVLNGSFNGRPLTEEELLPYMTLLLFGGLHTTGSVLATMMAWLADHPEGRKELRLDPSLLPTAVEEFVRISHPAAYVARTVKIETEIAGCPVKPGARVMFGIGSANRDPDKFDDPEHVHLDRSHNQHLGFGAGIHRCAGAHVAKMELLVALQEILARFGDFSIADRTRMTYTSGEMRGLESVPIVVTA